MDGLIIIDKPRGPSSFDVVRRVRQVAKMKRVGHTGTLDPDAAGVLGVALGKCTKLSQFVTLDRKTYESEIIFGIGTDSDDAMGEVVSEGPVEHLSAERIREALAEFEGEIQQIPPRFSAIHVDGKRAYDLARKGIDFELAARPVVVHELQLTAWDPERNVAQIRLECGPGTYVRSIARDLGAALGTVAHARGIRRIRVGPFSIEQSVALDALDEESLRTRLLSPAQMVANLPSVQLETVRCDAIGLGQRVVAGKEEFEVDRELELMEPVAVLDDAAELVAIVVVESTDGHQLLLKPKRVLKPKTGPGQPE